MSHELLARKKIVAAGLLDAAQQMRDDAHMKDLKRGDTVASELAEFHAGYCEDAAELIKILDLEVWRKNQAIGMHLQRMLERSELRKYWNVWNFDPPEAKS